MKKVISWTEFLKVLENNHFYNLDEKTKKMIFGVLKFREFSTDEVYSIINGARKKLILSAEDKKFVKLNIVKLIKNGFLDSDIELYKRLDEIDKIFKEYFKENNLKQKDYTDGLRDCWALAKRVNKDVNTELVDFTEEELKTFEVLARIYRSVAEHVENEPITAKVADDKGEYVDREFARIADYIVSTRLAKLSNERLSKIDFETAKQFDEFLRAITSTDDKNIRDTFSKEDVKDLLDQSISIIYKVTADKYGAIRDTFNAYFEEVMEQTKDKDSAEYEAFSNLTAKGIILRCASVIAQTPESIGFSLDFLLGKPMFDAGQNVIDASKSRVGSKYAKLLQKDFPELRLQDMDIVAHLYFAKQGPSHTLVLKPSTVYNTTVSLIDAVLLGIGEEIEGMSIVEKKARLKEKGFYSEFLYTRDNVFDVFASRFGMSITEKDGRMQKVIIENIRVLSEYLVPLQLQKVISHNFNLFLLDNQKVVEKLEEIKEKSAGDNKKFYQLFHKFINGKYKIYDDRDVSHYVPKGKKDADEEEDKIDLPEKKTIIVTINGKDIPKPIEMPKPGEAPVANDEIAFREKFDKVIDEIKAVTDYAISSKSLNSDKKLNKESISDLLLAFSLDMSPSSKNLLDEAVIHLIEQINEIIQHDECTELDVGTLKSEIDYMLSYLALKKQEVSSNLKVVDERILKMTKKEKDKAERSENIKDYDSAIKSLTELKGNRLIKRKYEKLVHDQEIEDLEVERYILAESQKEIADYRDKSKETNQSGDMRKSYILRNEIGMIETIEEAFGEIDYDKTKVVEKVETNITSEEDLKSRLEFLYTQRELKVRGIRIAYKNRIRNNDFDLGSVEGLREIVKGNPHGEDILKRIIKIDEEIAEIEAVMASNSANQ